MVKPDDLHRLLSASSLGGNEKTVSKLIVGVDYGTTYTGVAFVHQTDTDAKDIKLFTQWPNIDPNSGHAQKVPSKIAYAAENPDQEGQDTWGYEVAPDSKSCSWTKLLLDARAVRCQADDPGLAQALKSALFTLPRGKTPSDVVVDYLSLVYEHLMGVLKQHLGGEDVLDITPIEYCITVPAIWSDEAKHATRAAARRAGFGQREIDDVNLITEPEAAAFICLKENADDKTLTLKRGASVLVCDCGGGTVDLTSYVVSQTSPKMILNESASGSGGKCGGSYIDRNLLDLMESRFGSAFKSLPSREIGPGSRFMNAFEEKKRAFYLGTPKRDIRLPLKMPEIDGMSETPSGYDKRYGDVLLSKDDMISCFDPVVKKIIELISAQVGRVKKAKVKSIETLILVGGLGCSQFVRDSVNEWCSSNSIRMVLPWRDGWGAIARGAALHGLNLARVRRRMLRKHYGAESSRPYIKGTRLEPGRWEGRWTDPFTSETMITGYANWLVAKDSIFDEDTEIEQGWEAMHWEGNPKVVTNALYSCSIDEAPGEIRHPLVENVGSLTVDYTPISMDKFESTWDKQSQCKVWRFPVQVFIKLATREGILAVRSVLDGRDIGTGYIKYSRN